MRLFATMTVAALTASLLFARPDTPSTQPTRAEWDAVVAKATNYLKSTQAENGAWSEQTNIGVTGVALTGLLECGHSPDVQPAAKGLQFVESLINPKTGHIAGSDPRVGLQNYVTCVNVMALAASKRDKYKPVLNASGEFLKKLQWDEGESKAAADDYYGGAGYDSKSRPDLSNTQFFLDALKDAGVPESDPAYAKASQFVSRCQNLKSEFNDRPWANTINDGSFIYSAAGGGSTKTKDAPGAPYPGYGSMTYAGVKSLIYCNVGKNDVRMQAAIGWLKKNYTVDKNPGMPPQLGGRGLYYYYHTMGKTLDLLGDDVFVDAAGVKHDWRADLFRALQSRQRADGSWLNETDRWLEGDANLVTGYALMALSHCRPRD